MEGQNSAQALAEENQQLRRELNKLKRELRSLNDLYTRSQVAANAKANITALIEAERTKQDEYLRMLLTNSPDGILLFERDGRFAYCTEAFLQASGIRHMGHIDGKHFEEVLPGVARAEAFERFKAAFYTSTREGRRVELDIEGGFFAHEGERFYSVIITPIKTNRSPVGGAMVVFHDLTEVVNARMQAERASSAKSDFLANMSHEMRTPMNAIIGMTNIALNANDIEKKDYCLKKITDASNHLLGVINDVLDMSKIEANKLELSKHEFNFEKMLMRACDVIAFPLESKNQIFSVSIDRDLPATIRSDEQRLTQVVTNLLSNAVKFTKEGGEISLSASLEWARDGECGIRIEVRDSGIGISKEQQATLFQSFQQADSGIARKFGGTGLGLAISKSIVEMMNGTIWIESEAGEGSKFIFTLRAPIGSAHAEACPAVDYAKLKILAVDDDPCVREFFQSMAENRGLALDVAKDADEALMKIENSGDSPYSIFFVDYRMPGVDGMELTRRIKNIEKESHSVVIMITATEWARIEAEAKSAGVDRFIPKPLFPSSIIDAINDLVGVKQGAEAGEADTDYTGAFLGKRVLLAEDIEINQEIVKELLGYTGIEISCADDGKQALKLFQEAPQRYDVIFMDIHMPEMDGYEATRKLRALNDPWAKEVPIIAMTANVFREDIDKCLAAGMNGHVGKPLDIDEVLQRLNEYL